MEYRIKYIFKGTRDKGHEIADCHGTYMLYDNMQREEMSSPPEYLEEGFEFPELPETEYLTFNKDNSQMRGMAKNDKEHTHLPVTDNTGTNDDVDNYPLTEAVWIETEMPQAEYDLEEDKFPLVGTELANFLNFDIDCFMKPEEKQAVDAIQDIPGIGETSAQAVISVIGTNMDRFPTDRHIASWAGLCPGNNESANKRRSGKTRKGNALLRDTLVVCAHSAVKNKSSYFCAQFARVSAHRGKKRAYVAVAHSMLIAIYHIIKDGVVFKDLGADYYNQFNRERKINAYLKKLKALGWEAPVVAA